MEKIQTPRRGRRTVRALVIVCLLGFLATCAIVACGRALRDYGLGDALSPDTPMLELHVAYNGDKVASGSGAKVEMATSTVRPDCPAVVGGDGSQVKPRQRELPWGQPTPAPCPLVATWKVHRHPVAASMYITNGADFLSWYDKNRDFVQFRDSSLWQGLTRQLSTLLKVRAEDIELEGIQGQFLQQFIGEVIAADAVVHYDVIHGAGGVVFSFIRRKAPVVGRALPVIVRAAGTHAYRVTDFAQPIVEVRLQGMRLYLLERDERVYVGSSLEGLLNVLAEDLPAPPDLRGSVALVIRAEAYLDQVLNKATGRDTFPITVAFDLSEHSMAISEGIVPPAQLYRALGPSTAMGVLAAVPHDVLAALVLSAHVPVGEPVDGWALPVAAPATPGGLSLVWDVTNDKETPIQVGLAVPAPTGAVSEVKLEDYVAEHGVSAPCAGGAVWLAASSDALLARMKDACEKQSLSVLDYKGVDADLFSSHQVSFLVNMSTWLTEAYRLGGGDKPPEGATEVVQAVLRAQLEKVNELAKSLPIIGFTGRIGEPGGALVLRGFSAHVGGVQS